MNLPVRYISNPIIPSAGETAANDQVKSFVTVVRDGLDWHMLYYGSQQGAAVPYFNYASSSDGLAWSKPNLGRVTYSGNTNNNIVSVGVFTSGRYDETLGKWVATLETDPVDSSVGFFIYTADDPEGPYTFATELVHGVGHYEGKELIRRPDGRWVAYYTHGQSTDNRRISAFLSDTSDLTGTWTKYEAVIDRSDTTDQKYGIGVNYVGGTYYGVVQVYDRTGGPNGWGTIRLDLWASRTGVDDWQEVVQNYIPLGADGEFDDTMLVTGNRFTPEGDDWHIYYCGCPYEHEDPVDVWRDRAIGRATFKERRFIKYSGTGTLVTAPIALEPSSGTLALTVNANGSGGSVKVELLNASGNAIAGYTAADCSPITTDAVDHVPTWGGQPFPQVETAALRFVVTSAELFGYEVTRT